MVKTATKKRLLVLGATGSIGRNTLDVVAAHPDSFEIVGLSCGSDARALAALSARYPAAATALERYEAESAHDFSFVGPGSSERLARETEADLAVNGIAGAAGLLPSIAALRSGKDLALANKETIVMAGSLVMDLSATEGRRLLPVDSEHSAVFQLIQAHGAKALESVILTASGGPFRGWKRERLAAVSAAEALAHPTWKMGQKIAVDSATLANKGLEVIEAALLFSMPPERVEVLIHPQSRVHSLVRLVDGTLYAQISDPDMRLPIQSALFWPEQRPCPFGRLDLAGTNLSFEAPDPESFPMLDLAYVALRSGGRYAVAYNAADEIAVAAFLAGSLSFTDIPRIVETVLQRDWSGGNSDLDAILGGDDAARAAARAAIKELGS